MPASPATESSERERAAWMAAAQAGDRAAYQRVLAASIARVRAIARRQGVPVDALDDVVQETLLSVHHALRSYDPAFSYDAWLGAIATRRAIDQLRRHGRHARRELHDDAVLLAQPARDDVDDDAARAEQAARLRDAIAALPPRQREAVEQLGLGEQSSAEASARTGRNRGALKVNLHRALANLRKRLGGEP